MRRAAKRRMRFANVHCVPAIPTQVVMQMKYHAVVFALLAGCSFERSQPQPTPTWERVDEGIKQMAALLPVKLLSHECPRATVRLEIGARFECQIVLEGTGTFAVLVEVTDKHISTETFPHMVGGERLESSTLKRLNKSTPGLTRSVECGKQILRVGHPVACETDAGWVEVIAEEPWTVSVAYHEGPMPDGQRSMRAASAKQPAVPADGASTTMK